MVLVLLWYCVGIVLVWCWYGVGIVLVWGWYGAGMWWDGGGGGVGCGGVVEGASAGKAPEAGTWAPPWNAVAVG